MNLLLKASARLVDLGKAVDRALIGLTFYPAGWPELFQFLGAWPWLIGSFLIGLAWSRFPVGRAVLRRRWFWGLLAVLLILVLWLPATLVHQQERLSGQTHYWLSDDAMISMRYAANLAAGHGLVFNPGERVEGYSNFLWTALMALFHLLPLPQTQVSLAVLLADILLAAAIVPLIIGLSSLLGGGLLVTAAGLLAFVLSRDQFWAANSGLETTLLTLVFLGAVYRVLRDNADGWPSRLTYLLIGLLPLIRSDALVLSAVLAGSALVLTSDRRRVIRYVLWAALLPLAHLLWRVYYYGALLPNTAYLKVLGWDNRHWAGWYYVSDFLAQYWCILILAAAAAFSLKKKAAAVLLTGLLFYAFYVILAGGDVFPHFRFFAPVLPLVWLIGLLAVDRAGRRLAPRLALAGLALVSAPLLLPGYRPLIRELEFYRQADLHNVEIGLLIEHNTPPATKVAASSAGNIFYFSRRPAVDLLGKCDPYIARLKSHPGAMAPGHNKFDFGYSLGVLRPDLLVSELKYDDRGEISHYYEEGDWAYTGQLFINPVFRRNFLPHPVMIDTRCIIFAADWSDQKAFRHDWRMLPDQ